MADNHDSGEFARLRAPTEDEYAEIAKKLGLSQEQAWELTRSVGNAVATAKAYNEFSKTLPPYSYADIRSKAETIDELLGKLEKEIFGGRAVVAQIEVPDNLGELGLLVSFQTIADLFGQHKVTQKVADLINRPSLTEPEAEQERVTELSLLEVEEGFAQTKQVLDVHNRPDLLLHIVKVLRKQFRLWLDRQGTNAGGRTPSPARRILIAALSQDASRILGKPPTKTGGVAFVRLCTDVFEACGMDTDGISDAIKNYLKIPEERAKVDFYNDVRY